METKTLDVNAFWERLKQISKTRNISQKDCCTSIGIDYQMFRNKKTVGSFPTLEQLVKIARLYGVSLDYLATGEIYEEPEINRLQSELDETTAKYNDLKQKLTDIVSNLSSE